jgi:hypothetical protein
MIMNFFASCFGVNEIVMTEENLRRFEEVQKSVDLMFEIFRHLSFYDLTKVARVSKRWKILTEDSKLELKSFSKIAKRVMLDFQNKQAKEKPYSFKFAKNCIEEFVNENTVSWKEKDCQIVEIWSKPKKSTAIFIIDSVFGSETPFEIQPMGEGIKFLSINENLTKEKMTILEKIQKEFNERMKIKKFVA